MELFYQNRDLKMDKQTGSWLQKWNILDEEHSIFGKKSVYLQEIYPREASKKKK